MDNQPKTQPVRGTFMMAIGFLVWMFTQIHGCDLKSLWIEIPMLLCLVIIVPGWTQGASARSSNILRSIGAVVIMIGLAMSYLSWLHSDCFPKWLLFPKPRIHHRVPNNGAAANRRYAGQLDDFMKFDCQDCIWESRSAAVAELGR
jgi:hypothetical protein